MATRTTRHEVGGELLACIAECSTCHDVCEETITHSLRSGGDFADTELVRALIDCAQICQTSADFMLRSSTSYKLVCDVCAQVCAACADECERFEHDDWMRTCAQTLRSCTTACQKMAGAKTRGERTIFEGRRQRDDWRVDEASEESFPASDPPGH